MRSTLSIPVAVIGVAGMLLAGCGTSDSSQTSSQSSADPTSEVTGDITVFAAASLTATFTEIGTLFETEYPGTAVKFSFAGSSDLVTQLSQGAPADVFASADTNNMTKAVDGGLIDGDPTNFATNTLTIVTAPGNPKNVTSFADLANPGVLTVICAPQVPCGNATKKVEDATGTTIPAVSEESAVTDVLGKVTSGQADAGLVYVTDASGAGDQVSTTAFPESTKAVNTYPIAITKSSRNTAAAKAFEEFVAGTTGQKVLAEAGFAAP